MNVEGSEPGEGERETERGNERENYGGEKEREGRKERDY